MTGRSQTLPWWLEGGGVKTTGNKKHWPHGVKVLGKGTKKKPPCGGSWRIMYYYNIIICVSLIMAPVRHYLCVTGTWIEKSTKYTEQKCASDFRE
jgi:hypothetical protein